MRIIVFGTGRYYFNRKEKFQSEEIVGFLDNSKERQGTLFEKKLVYAPNEVIGLQFDYIILMSVSVEEMRKQLEKIGVSDSKILCFETYLELKIIKNNNVKAELEKILGEHYMKIFSRSENCKDGSELWQYYKLLRDVVESTKIREQREEELEDNFRRLFAEQILLIDKDSLWKDKEYIDATDSKRDFASL